MEGEMEEPHYVIVDFPEESSNGEIAMGLISSTWILRENDSYLCYWPSYLKSTISREKAIRNHTVLEYNKCWRCQILILYHLREYDKAKAKLHRLENCETSSPSDSSFSELSARKPKAKIDSNYKYDFDDDDDSEQSLIENPPPLKKTVTYQNKPNSNNNCESITSGKHNYDSQQACQIPENCNVGNKNYTLAGVFSTNTPQVLSKENYSIFADKDKTFVTLKNANSVEQVLPTHKPVAEPDSNVKRPDLPHCDCESAKIFKLLTRLLRDVQEIKSEVKKMNATDQVQKKNEFQNLQEELNFLSYDALLDFDEKLRDMEYFDMMQTTLVLLGGRDLSECTRKILNAIMGPDLSLKVNWIGANLKGSFQKAKNLLRLIYGTIRRNTSCSSATNAEIDKVIKTWLKNSADREGGRNHRRKCGITEQN